MDNEVRMGDSMKTLKKVTAIALAIATLAPLGTSLAFANEENIQVNEQPETTTETALDSKGLENSDKTKPVDQSKENQILEEEKSDENSENKVTTKNATEEHSFDAYVPVGQTVQMPVGEKNYMLSDSWSVADGYESMISPIGEPAAETTLAQYELIREVEGMFYKTTAVNVNGLKEGKVVLKRTLSKIDTINGEFQSVNVTEWYTIHIVPSESFTTQTVKVAVAPSLKEGTSPDNLLQPAIRYYFVGSLELGNLPKAGPGVILDVANYTDAITEAFEANQYIDDDTNPVDLDAVQNASLDWDRIFVKQDENGNYYWELQGNFIANEAELTSIIVTDGVDGEEVFEDENYTVIRGFDPTSQLKTPTREGYEFVDWNKTVQEDGTIVYEAQWKAVEKESASLEIEFIDKDTKESVGENQVIQSEPGIVGEEYTFVSGEYEVTIPEGYKCISEYPTVPVKYGESTLVKLYVEKMTNPAQPGQEEDANNESQNGTDKKSEQTDGTNTGVAMSLAGVFGTMSIALAGMITLLKKKK